MAPDEGKACFPSKTLISPKCLNFCKRFSLSKSIESPMWGSKENVIFVSEVEIKSTERLYSLNNVKSSARIPDCLHISSLVRLRTVTFLFLGL